MSRCFLQSQPIPDKWIGSLNRSSSGKEDPASLQRQIEADGYVWLPSALNRDEVLAARQEVFERLADVDEIKRPAVDGIATGSSSRSQQHPDLGVFWQSVSEGPQLRQVTHGDRLQQILSACLAEPARPHDLMYLRAMPVGGTTSLHYDYPFFAGKSERIHTAWVPLGDISVEDGPLMVVQNSHHFDDLVKPMRAMNFADDHSNDRVQQAAYQLTGVEDPVVLAEQRRTRLLSADFRAGDVVVFSGVLLHGSLQNQSPIGQVRLSCDVRYQPMADSAEDDRYIGANPKGSKGNGYADMKAAQPLNS